MLEHLFLSRLLREAWSRRGTTVEVLHPEVDSAGYDLVLEHNGFVRHIQLKASRAEARTDHQSVYLGLTGKPAACVIWIKFDDLGPDEKVILSYWYFGGAPDEPLRLDNLRASRRTTYTRSGDRAERPNHRDVPAGRFRRLANISEVYDVLFTGKDSRPRSRYH